MRCTRDEPSRSRSASLFALGIDNVSHLLRRASILSFVADDVAVHR